MHSKMTQAMIQRTHPASLPLAGNDTSGCTVELEGLALSFVPNVKRTTDAQQQQDGGHLATARASPAADTWLISVLCSPGCDADASSAAQADSAEPDTQPFDTHMPSVVRAAAFFARC